MTSTKLTLPGKVTVAHLQALCLSTGLPQAGSKSAIQQTLRQAAQSLQHIPDNARILSIDLGLKNFAFSLLTPAPSPSKEKHIPTPSDSTATSQALLPPVHLHHWNHLDLTTPLFTLPPLDDSISPDPQPIDFNPTSLSPLTYSLISTYLLPLKPTHILIERQRFRTGNASNIFEWTIRVNTLEAMLHACFATLSGLNLFKGKVISISPKTVARYLFPDTPKGSPEIETGKRKKLNPYHLLKTDKVAMLGEWLKQGRLIKPKEQGAEMARGFLQAWEAKGTRGKKKEVEGILGQGVKLDDLSDSVLQGMVWLQWQRNLEGLRGLDFGKEMGNAGEKAVKKVKKGTKKIKGADVKDKEEGEAEVEALIDAPKRWPKRAVAQEETLEELKSETPKRSRGQSRKAEVPEGAVEEDIEEMEVEPVRKRVGLPKKTPVREELDQVVVASTQAKKKGRGRPKTMMAVEDEQAPTRKLPGRPKKTPGQEDGGEPIAMEVEVKKSRGRPKKPSTRDETDVGEVKVDSVRQIWSPIETDEDEDAVLI